MEEVDELDDELAEEALFEEARSRGIPPMVDLLEDQDLLVWWERLTMDPTPSSKAWVELAFFRLEKVVENVDLLRREKDLMLERFR